MMRFHRALALVMLLMGVAVPVVAAFAATGAPACWSAVSAARSECRKMAEIAPAMSCCRPEAPPASPPGAPASLAAPAATAASPVALASVPLLPTPAAREARVESHRYARGLGSLLSTFRI